MNKNDKAVKKRKINEAENKLVKDYYKHIWGKGGDKNWHTTQETKSDKQTQTT